MEADKVSKAVENFIAIPLIILIGLYIVASAIIPFIHLNNQTFTIIFTLAGGIPALTFYFKEKYVNYKSEVKRRITDWENHI